MAERTLRVCALYPDLMNIYADRGNLLLLERRCQWRGIGFEVVPAGLGEGIDPDAHDLFYIGGAQDRDQALCAQDMVDTKRDALHAAADAGRVVLAVCGGYQLLGHHYQLGDERIPGVGLVDLHTVREDGPRLIGNVAIEVRLPGLGGVGGAASSPGSRTTGVARTSARALGLWAACSRATATPAARGSRASCAATSSAPICTARCSPRTRGSPTGSSPPRSGSRSRWRSSRTTSSTPRTPTRAGWRESSSLHWVDPSHWAPPLVHTPNTAHVEGLSSHPQAATLEFRNVSKTYDGSAEPAIQDLTFEVPAGEICVLVGPSGCGKTTAMRLVNRMIELTSGDILVGGVSVRTRRPADLRRQIGYAIQQIGLFPHATIAENIATVPRVLGWPRERIRARVDELIELIGLDPAETRDRYPAQLSGGQRQRVGVARALAADPPLMLMDEPFGAIDPINRERLQDELLGLQERIRKTIVFVTHDINEAIKLGDRIAVLKKGGVLAQYATPVELLMHPADEFVEGFVGSDRALKRLALTRASEVEQRPVDDGLPFALVRDEAGRPVAWERGGERHPVRTVRGDESLRDALSDLLASPVELGAVVDDEGRVTGVIGLDAIHALLTREEEGEA